MEMCQDKNELRIALPDMLDPLMNMLDFTVKRLLSSNTCKHTFQVPMIFFHDADSFLRSEQRLSLQSTGPESN
jgi:hypothetical protein